jgi:LEA14-like dessication related protein
MKKNLLLVFAAAGMMAACSNPDTDKRITQLEQRVAALEGTGQQSPVVQGSNDFTNTGELVANQEPVATGPTAKIEFEETEYNFGSVKDGAIVSHTFKFKNTGSVPLVVQDAKATCGCTVPKKPEKPIAPGQTGEIEVRFDSSNKVGNQNKSVTITANTEPATTTIFVKGTVEPKASAAAGTDGPVRN